MLLLPFLIIISCLFNSIASSSTKFTSIPDEILAHMLAFNFLDFESTVKLAQTCKPLRSLIVQLYMDFILCEYSQLNQFISLRDHETLFSILVRPHNYSLNGYKYRRRIPPYLLMHPELFINALVSNPHRLLQNNQLVIYVIKLYISLYRSQRTAKNDSDISKKIVDFIIPNIYANPVIMKSLGTFYGCSRSDLPQTLFKIGHRQHRLVNILSPLIRYYRITKIIYIFSIFAVLTNILPGYLNNVYLFPVISFICWKVAEILYNNFFFF